MSEKNQEKLKIMIIEDEENNLTAYKDFLLSKGHEVFSYFRDVDFLSEFQRILPNICIIDYKPSDDRSGLDIAKEVLNRYPWSVILFITAYQPFQKLLRHTSFRHKNVKALLKPVKPPKIKNTVSNLVNKSKSTYTQYNSEIFFVPLNVN
jgi:DNA-binding NtrC family response regulator